MKPFVKSDCLVNYSITHLNNLILGYNTENTAVKGNCSEEKIL